MRKTIKNPFTLMQKVAAVKLCIISLFCLFTSIVNAQETWNYPMKPGMEEWRQFKSMDEMYQACQIPNGVLKNLDTESLVNICFDFPAYMGMFFSNTPQAGFNDFYTNADFNPQWNPEDQGRFVYKYQFFETLLAQPQVIQTLNSNGRNELLKEAIKKFDMKLSRQDLSGGATFAVNDWIMARTLNFENKLTSKFTAREDIELSLKSGQLIDYDLMSIYEQFKTHTNGK